MRLRSKFHKKICRIANGLWAKYRRHMPKASGHCSDCGTTEFLCHDHRDYSDILKADVVCHSCNQKRGPASIPFYDVESLDLAFVYRDRI